MAQAPPRPDLEAGSPFEPARPSRPTFAVGLAAALIWLGAAVAAYRGIGWYPPPTAMWILFAGTPVALVLGLVATQMHSGRSLVVLSAILLAASLLLPFVMAAVVPGVAHPDQTPLPGGPALAFAAAPEGNFEMWVMRGDADHVSRLTTTTAWESGGDLSPDGTHVVYSSNASGTFDLWVMTLGPGDTPRDVHAIAGRKDADEEWPRWSPDGTLIAYTVDAGSGSEVWSMSADGTDAHRISDQPGASGPAWSPDGSRIAYSAITTDDGNDDDIWVANADGSDAADEIDAGGDEWAPFWSPDGTTLSFSSNAAGNEDAWTCSLPCTDPESLTADSDARDWAAGWTPDGHALVLSDRLYPNGVFLYFIDDDGRIRLSLII